VLFALFRGNTQAIVNASALIGFIVLAYDERYFFLRSILLAISINIRPISAVFIFYYYLKGNYKEFLKSASVVIALTIVVLLLSLAVDGARYDAYDMNNFLEGVKHYKWIYLTSPRYLQEEYNTSLYALIRNNDLYDVAINSIKWWIYGLIGMVMILVKGQIVYGKSEYTSIELFYLLFCGYIFVFPINIVYHMIPLLEIISLALRYKSSNDAITSGVIAVASVIIITAKDFLGKGFYSPVIFRHIYDLQLLVNVFTIMLSVIIILIYRQIQTLKKYSW
jgi:hypothetical protein